MVEAFEMGEVIAAQTAIDEIGQQMEQLQTNYQEALAGGYTDMAEAYQRKMEELAENAEPEEKPEYHQGRQHSFEEKLQAHQGMTSEDSSEDDLGAHQGSGELSFGANEIRNLKKKVDKWERDVKFHEKQVERSVRRGSDTSVCMSDLNSARKQYEKAVKDLEWAKNHL